MNLLNRYKTLNPGIRASLWFTIASLFQKGIAFIATPFYTRLLATSEYGIFATYNSWLSIITIFATFNLSAGVMNNALTKKDRFNASDKQILSSFQFLEIITISSFSALIILFNLLFPNVLKIEQKALYMICITVMVTSGISLLTTKERFNYNFLPIIIITIVSSLLIPIANVLIILYGNDNNYALIYGTTLISVIVYFPIMISNLARGKKLIDVNLWKYALLFNLPLIPHYLSLVVLSSSDKIMIERLQNSSSAALFSIPLGIVSLITIFSTAINASLIPATYQKLKAKDYGSLSKYVNAVLLFFLSLSFLLILAGPEAVLLMGGREYVEAKWVIPPVAASVFFSFLYPLFANVEFFYEKRLMTTICSVAAAVLNIFLNYIFIKMFGYVAAAFTTLFCYSMLALFHYVAYKVVSKKNSVKHLYNEKSILVFSIAILSFIPLGYLLYINDEVRYKTIIIISILIIVFSSKIYLFIKKNIFNRE